MGCVLGCALPVVLHLPSRLTFARAMPCPCRPCPCSCVYIAPLEALAKERFADWSARFGKGLGLNVVQLTGEAQADIKLLEKVGAAATAAPASAFGAPLLLLALLGLLRFMCISLRPVLTASFPVRPSPAPTAACRATSLWPPRSTGTCCRGGGSSARLCRMCRCSLWMRCTCWGEHTDPPSRCAA